MRKALEMARLNGYGKVETSRKKRQRIQLIMRRRQDLWKKPVNWILKMTKSEVCM